MTRRDAERYAGLLWRNHFLNVQIVENYPTRECFLRCETRAGVARSYLTAQEVIDDMKFWGS
jgi:hypothetical protein